MLYIFEDSPRKVIPLRSYNCSEVLVSESIDEILHSFNGQYSAAEKIAKAVYENLKYEDKTTVVNVSEFEIPLKRVSVTVEDGNILKTSAWIDKVLSNGEMHMTIALNVIERHLSKEEIINSIASAVVHEISHGGIYLLKFNNGKYFTADAPAYYDAVVKILESNDYAGTDIYYFAYALYSTYYHEVQAIISQTIHDVMALLPKDKEPDNESLKQAVRQTNSYKAFTSNINIADKLLSAPIEEKLEIADELIKNGINIIDIDKEAKRIKKVSERALKAISANLMRIYEYGFWNRFNHNK